MTWFSWYVADGFIPEASTGSLQSHEAICVLNPSEHDAAVTFTFFFADTEPLSSTEVVIPAARALHLRTDDAEDMGGVRLPTGTPYAIRIRSNVELAVQYSRLDSTQPAMTLMTTFVPATDD